ncbi:UPF0482 protein [Salmonella enterica subsp. enterica serovar Choleraesuis]|nr:UPF0482 protein [Salmonella enterica subsp. enterica serovar Choleraesuis]
MKTIGNKRLLAAFIPLALLGSMALSAPVSANSTQRLVIESGDSSLSRQEASMEKEQWSDTRSLRQKVNRRVEKEWDKSDVAFDARDNCLKSTNINAYWEPNTLRCLDRTSGRVINP